MLKKAIIIGIFLFVLVFASPAFAKITISPSGGQVKVIAADGVATLNRKNPQATVRDAAGASADIAYDAETGEISAEALSGTPRFGFGIADIFMDEGKNLDLETNEGYRIMRITNISVKGIISMTFPDGSRLALSEGTEILLTKLADDSYDLTIVKGTAEYTGPDGNKQTLTPNSPPINVQGFGIVPDWRSTEIERHPATP